MDWFSFAVGAIFGGGLVAVFRDGEESEEFSDEDVVGGAVVPVSEGTRGRTVVLSCQTCRKLKRHREIENGLYQCTKCKRHVDIRAG